VEVENAEEESWKDEIHHKIDTVDVNLKNTS
jgi:hypothetical protein